MLTRCCLRQSAERIFTGSIPLIQIGICAELTILPATQVVGLSPLEETIETARKDSVELDLVTHDVKKFFKLLLRPNGYVLEQLLSPIVVHSTTEHEELKAISVDCLTRHTMCIITAALQRTNGGSS